MIWLMRDVWSRREGEFDSALFSDSYVLEDMLISALGDCVLMEINPSCLSKV